MLKIVNESILDQEVEIIVNPANSHLRHGGGLARIIADAATRPFRGSDMPGANLMQLRNGMQTAQWEIDTWNEEHAEAPLIPTGSAWGTTAGRLPFELVIHAVGPVWGGGHLHEADLLGKAYRRAFQIASCLGYSTIAVPAIGMGIFGVPKEVVARVAVNAAREYAHKLDITICLTSDEDVALFETFR